MKFYCLQGNGWNWRTLSLVKLARFRKPKAICFLSYVEYRPNTNTSNILKDKPHKGEVTYERGRVKEGS
jgi:hypothetical protein